MSPLKAGDKLPDGVEFTWAPITDPDPTACGVPQTYEANKEWKGKKVVLVSVPGAFTPGCQARHLPPYMEKIDELRSKGVDLVVFIASNDAWVMNAWGKVNGATPDSKVLFMSDTKSFFSKNHAWEAGMGDRNGRWAMVIEPDSTISYSEVDGKGKVEVSGAESVLAKL